MPYSPRFYDHMPLYARLADDEHLLEHVCDSVQPPFAQVRKKLAEREYYFNPAHPSSAPYLDWLGQWVGLAVVDGKWLGIGLNPDWREFEKRRVVLAAWKYWQLKGTEWGIREAMRMWLGWEGAHDRTRHQIFLPFGKRPTKTPPSWWGYDTTYDAHLTQLYPERQHLGSGDYSPGVDYQPTWQEWKKSTADLLPLPYALNSPPLTESVPEPIPHSTSHLGPNRPWQHFYLKNGEEWNQLFPNIYELTPEAWSSQAIPTLFGWWVAEAEKVILRSSQLPRTRTITEFDVDGIHYGDFYPYLAREAGESTQLVSRAVDFGIVGSDYLDWLGGLGRQGYSTTEVIATPEIAIAGCNYEREWYDARSQASETISLTPYDGNLANAFEWFDFPEGDWWYFAPGAVQSSVWQIQDIDSALPPYQTTVPAHTHTETLDQIAPPYPGNLWTVYPHQTIVSTLETVVIPAVACTPGMLADFVTGVDEWTVVHDAIAGSQLVKWVPGTSEYHAIIQLNTGVAGFEWGDWEISLQVPYFAAPQALFTPPTELLSPAAPLSSTDPLLPSDRLVRSYPPPAISEAHWYTASFPSPVDQVIRQPNHWQLEQPTRIADYFMPYDHTSSWYAFGEADWIETVEIPKVERVQLCNVVDNWTMKQIIYWREYDVLIPENDLNYSLMDIYPILQHLRNGNDWCLYLETTTRLIQLAPTTIIWVDPADETRRSTTYSQDQRFTKLLLEFVVQPAVSDRLKSLLVEVDGTRIYQKAVDLDFRAPGTFGFRFTVPTEPEPATTMTNGNLPDLTLTTEEELPELTDTISPRLPLNFIRLYTLRDRILTTEASGLIKTTFLVDTGLDSNRLEIGQIQLAQPPHAEVPRPETRVLPNGTIEVVFRRDVPILNDQVRIWVMCSSTPNFLMSKNLRGGLVTITSAGLVQTEFSISTELGHSQIEVGQIRTIAPPSTEVDRPMVEVIGDVIRLVFWANSAIADDTLQVFIRTLEPILEEAPDLI